MAEDSESPVDLFGDPWTPPRDPRGRKRHRPSAQAREFVAVLKGGQASDEEIALQLGLCVKTLKRYYSRELEHGATLARNQMLKRLYQAGLAGNVAAMKAYLAETEKGQAAEVIRGSRARREQPLGKKEQRQAEAAEVGGLYAPGAAPGVTSH